MLAKSVSEEFERLRFLGRGGDLVSGGFRRRGRPIWGESLCVVLLFGEERGDPTLVIGDSEKLNSADAPEIERLSEPEGVEAAEELSVGVPPP